MKAAVWLRFLACIYVMALVSISILNWKGPERFWLGAVNLYMPQVMWAVPGMFLTVFMFKADRCWAWLPLLCLLWVLGPVMGYCWSMNQPEPAPGSLNIRVMTWNIKYDRRKAARFIREIDRCKPDVLLFQDAWNSMRGPLGKHMPPDWHVLTRGQYVIASRYPLSEAEVHELPFSGKRKESFLRCRMTVGSTAISLYNVHFKTPRNSFYTLSKAKSRPWDLPEFIRSFDNNMKIRIAQAATIREYLIAERGPVILSGDLNAPDASLVCSTLRGAGLRDAFAEGGRGYGYTYGHFLLKNRLPWLRFSWMRIDHIMINAQLKTRNCRVGTGKASDHRPVIADMVIKAT
ncbi:MAG: hypothetical protein A4E74_01221 [Syntrophus sp. PtaB.Bin075]|nr:MAG: hypothetical protein A4E74_01221 [Syntrophus sp. PtaB.Bin075]